MRGVGSPGGQSPGCLLGVHIPPQLCQSEVHSGACTWVGEGSGGPFSEEWLKDLGLLSLEKRKLREILRVVSMSLLKIYFGIISQRKIGTNVEKLQGGKLP